MTSLSQLALPTHLVMTALAWRRMKVELEIPS